MEDILNDYFEVLKKNSLKGNNLIIFVSPTDTMFAVFSYTDYKDIDGAKTQVLDYIAAATARKPTIRAGGIKSYTDGNIRAVGSIMGFRTGDEEAIASLTERCVFAASTADDIRATGRIDDIVKIYPNISCIITSRGEFVCKCDMTKDGLTLLNGRDKKNVTIELRDVCKYWLRPKFDDVAEFGIERKNLVVRPKCDLSDTKYLESYGELIADIILDGGELFDERWSNADYVMRRIASATESVSLSDAADREFKSPLESSGFIAPPKLTKRKQDKRQTSLFTTEQDKEKKDAKEETPPPEKQEPVKITYNIKRLEAMGIDELFFHRLLR